MQGYQGQHVHRTATGRQPTQRKKKDRHANRQAIRGEGGEEKTPSRQEDDNAHEKKRCKKYAMEHNSKNEKIYEKC